jgi:hypothetical protein
MSYVIRASNPRDAGDSSHNANSDRRRGEAP